MKINIIYVVICLIAGYGFGCFSTAYFIGKLHHIDLRKEGSGNLGTTNALRTLGKAAAAFTFIGDLLKAIIPVLVTRYIFRENYDVSILMGMLAGFGVVLGHNFPFWLKFKGGKGIAVTAAVILCIAHWPVVVAGLVVFVGIVAVTRYVSLGSLVSVLALPVNIILFHRSSEHFIILLAVSCLFVILAYVQHRENIVRLIHGNERKIGEKKSENS